MRRLIGLLALAIACRKPVPPPPVVLVDATTSSASAVASAEPPDAGAVVAAPAIDAGPLRESLEGFEGATLDALPVELLPSDQRKRVDKKTGPVRIASVRHPSKPGLALFGLSTATVEEGPVSRNWFVRSGKNKPLATPIGAAVAFEEMLGRFGPDPVPSLLVVEDAARNPVATRFVGVPLDIKEIKLGDGPAFLVRTLRGPSGIDDPVDLDVVALRAGELVSLLRVYVGFRDIEPCGDGSHMSTLGPPGSVIGPSANTLHVREAKSDCDSPAKVSAGCAGTERDYAWDAAKGTLVPGASKAVTLTAARTACP